MFEASFLKHLLPFQTPLAICLSFFLAHSPGEIERDLNKFTNTQLHPKLVLKLSTRQGKRV
ncbi:hypothetical protein HanPSC8_Chr04g0172171 [Helianthus annuus]|nr:hypothetical protein HanPSC8_Chr04g0172171 [Helianthus annuus]